MDDTRRQLDKASSALRAKTQSFFNLDIGGPMRHDQLLDLLNHDRGIVIFSTVVREEADVDFELKSWQQQLKALRQTDKNRDTVQSQAVG
ncbi:hypothetical protein CCR75_004851 [Bremia lactucae]|uniref:Uncharacterized protein n=1 Tax=Bremia lactucae TaxID=4779 RepID=A0A976FHV4_BRELC|nr:hypothetical protein CCR75_004851 [Bremia lactucae]